MSTPLVPDDNNVFYSYPFNPKTHQPDLSKAVASKYLVVNGSKIIDPVAGGSEHLNLYESLNPDGSVNENSRFQNANNYLIVPANYDPSEASTYAKSVNADMTSASRMGPAAGLAVGLADMTKDFWPGGSQDLRRGRNWGIPDNEVAPAFKDSASWDFGFTAAPTLIPNVLAEIGGGVLNIFEYVRHPKEHKTPTLPFGMDGADEEDFQAGVQAAEPAGGHGLEAIYNDVLAIGHWLHGSIAPIKGPPTRSSGPRRQAEHASNDDSPPPGLAANSAAHAHSYMATNAPVSSETGVPHALYNYFDQIGEQTLKGGAIETIAPYVGRGKQLGFSVLKVSMDDAETLPTLFAPYLSHLSGLLGPSSSVGKTYSELLHYSPFLEREALPSIAPIGRRGMAEASGERMIARYDEIGEQAARQHSKPDIPAAQKLDPLKLRSALQDLLTQQARLPPSGATAFDPRVTPAWPGLQLPA
jgi:hypothetical protein